MKKYYIASFFLCHIFLSSCLFAQNDFPIVRNNISEDIYDALSSCYEEFSEAPLESIYESLENDYAEKPNRKYKYWQAYVKMYAYIYSKNSSDLGKSIEIIDSLKVKTSEEFALLAFLKSFKMSSIKDKTELKSISIETKNLAIKALNTDNNNLRAYYVLAALEYYNPNSDKKKVKNYLDEGLKIVEKSEDYYDITWGRNLLYELYIKYYLKNKKINKAKKIYEQAISEFPNDYLINKYYELGRK